MNNFFYALFAAIERQSALSPIEFAKVKLKIAKSTGISLPSNRDILREYRKWIKRGKKTESDSIVSLLRIRKIRTLSGISAIGVHTKPLGCPGQCVYCPTEVRMPKSYLSTQPAVMRSAAVLFNPKKMVRTRIEQLERNGHPTDKNELIVMGGTWSAHPVSYQEEFIQQCFDGFNGARSKSLEEAQKMNETAQHRVVGLTLETRPDWVTEGEVKQWIRYGATRAEIGVQTIDENVLRLIRRGHRVDAVRRATVLFKEAGFKITYHLMPGLPGSSPERDLEMFAEIFSNPNFRPDQIKIYPCIVNEYAELYQWWKDGRFKPYDDEILRKVLPKMKVLIPPWVRLSRIFRDIPGQSIQAGGKSTNIRQIIHDEMKKAGKFCQCIRCREPRDQSLSHGKVTLFCEKIEASSGQEIFLSIETKDRKILFAFLRLRINNDHRMNHHFIPSLHGAAIVRELHVYGAMVPLHEKISRIQHSGLGRQLMMKAEEICRSREIKRLAVISGVGVREYYKKLGYHFDGGYMIKNLSEV